MNKDNIPKEFELIHEAVTQSDLRNNESQQITGLLDIIQEKFEQLQQQRDKMQKAIENVLKLKDLWFPKGEVSVEHEDELKALYNMEQQLSESLNTPEEEKPICPCGNPSGLIHGVLHGQDEKVVRICSDCDKVIKSQEENKY